MTNDLTTSLSTRSDATSRSARSNQKVIKRGSRILGQLKKLVLQSKTNWESKHEACHEGRLLNNVACVALAEGQHVTRVVWSVENFQSPSPIAVTPAVGSITSTLHSTCPASDSFSQLRCSVISFPFVLWKERKVKHSKSVLQGPTDPPT